MTGPELRTLCLGLPGAVEEYPFRPDVSVFKVGGKMFALSMLADDPLRVSVKCDPELGVQLRGTYPSITPGYHLNKRHWLTIALDGSVADELVADLVEGSYELVAPARLRGLRQPGVDATDAGARRRQEPSPSGASPRQAARG